MPDLIVTTRKGERRVIDAETRALPSPVPVGPDRAGLRIAIAPED